MDYDYHVHSTYSDGSFLRWMVRAAERAGLEGVGIADHCNVSERESMVAAKRDHGFNLDLTHERRRSAIERVREDAAIDIFDAVELDYDPRDEDAIRRFLDGNEFDYAIGSVHTVDDLNVQVPSLFDDWSESDRRDLTDDYFDGLVALIESELFEIAAHPDLLERNPNLRGFATDEHYRRVAEAFERSRTVPELNAGRVLRDYGEFSPRPAFLSVLREYDVAVTLGSDSHRPDEIAPRHERVREFREEIDLDLVELNV
ncbi:PHP domain-containing protein [Halomarina pelagica]|uniref:PHP domain-containing protein n=1 Tax=Halomarina pelagica TaxID=2961599 RepID=UPI0020C3A2CD|nr:PHP domain-containing protein [Halomarina sp. BND7]